LGGSARAQSEKTAPCALECIFMKTPDWNMTLRSIGISLAVRLVSGSQP
jgi:hypothetical protein